VEEIDYEELCGLKTENEIPVEGFTPEELAKKIENGDPMTIVDVREPHERAILRFPNAVVIPIGQLARRQKDSIRTRIPSLSASRASAASSR
jgi:Rhodanese-like domain.